MSKLLETLRFTLLASAVALLRIKVSFIDITYDIIDIHYIEEFLIFVMPLLFLYYSSSGSKNARPHRTDAILKLRVAPES